MISGSGFTPVSVKGGLGPEKVHRIDGRRPRVAILNGEMLRSPNLGYPINLDEDGNFFAMLTLPSNMRFTNFLTKWGNYGSADGGFVTPSGVAVDGSGNIYVSEKDGHRVQKFDSSGRFLTKWGSLGNGNGEFNSPVGTAVDKSGNVYVADSGNHRIQKFNSSGRFLTKWGRLGSGNGKFNSPVGTAVDRSGNVYVADSGNHRIQKFNSSGRFLTKWGSIGSGNGKFNSPVGTAVDKSGNVYVADSGNDRVQKFNSSGRFLTKWGSIGIGDGEFLRPRDLAVDDSGNIYVSEKNGHRVQKFNSSGRFLTKWGSFGNGNGEFNSPVGTAVDKSGNVYVADLGNHRIQKFDSSMNRGNLELRVTDSGGRTGSVYLTVSAPSVIFDPASVYPGETVGVQGIGFAASNPAIGVENGVRIDYEVVYNEGKSNQYYFPRLSTEVIVDGSGNFSTRFKVPRQAKIPSSNRVSITPKHGEVVHVIHKVPPPSITADPNAVFPNQQVEITLGGIGADSKIFPGTVTLGRIAIPIPGYSGYPGPRPKADQGGRVTFSSTVPKNIPTGLQYLDHRLSGDRLLRSNIVVLTADLKMTPETAAPGQVVFVSSLNLSPADEGAPGPVGNHQISGAGVSTITLGGKSLGMKKSVYPIDLDNKGRLLLPLVLPVNNVTLAGGPVQMKVTDTGGRTGIGTFNIKRPTLTVSPATSIRGSVLKASGDGFVVTRLNDTSRYLIDIEYDRRRVATTYIDPDGAFNVSFKVPSDIKINSENVVTAKVRQLSSEAKAAHRVPGRAMAVSPQSASRGGKLTITGTGLVPFQVVYIKVADAWVVLSGLYTDVNGAFTHTISLSEGISLGEQVVKVNTPNMYGRLTVTITRR
jgi:streptogramin lyase